MIPKVLHYCWFGGNELPESVTRCLRSWERLLPEFEVKRWDESNFDINLYQFAADAYQMKKFAFVADVCRVHVLKEEGGVYLDTDMLFIQMLDDSFLENEVFFGWESDAYAAAGIIGSVANSLVMNEFCDFYKNAKYPQFDEQELSKITIPIVIMEILKPYGVSQGDGAFVRIDNLVTIYPRPVFYAKDVITGYTDVTDSTIAIHLYDASWVSEVGKREYEKYRLTMRLGKSVRDLKEHYSIEEVIQIFRKQAGLSSAKLFGCLIRRFLLKNFKRRGK